MYTRGQRINTETLPAIWVQTESTGPCSHDSDLQILHAERPHMLGLPCSVSPPGTVRAVPVLLTASPGVTQAPETCCLPLQSTTSPAVWANESLFHPKQNRQCPIHVTELTPKICPFAFIWIKFLPPPAPSGLTSTMMLWLTLGSRASFKTRQC